MLLPQIELDQGYFHPEVKFPFRIGSEEKCVLATLLFRGSQAVSSPAGRVIDLLEFPIRMGSEEEEYINPSLRLELAWSYSSLLNLSGFR